MAAASLPAEFITAGREAAAILFALMALFLGGCGAARKEWPPLPFPPNSSRLPRLVLRRIAGANQSVGFGLNGASELLEVLGNMTKIVEQFVNVFRVHVHGLVQPAGQIVDRHQRAAKIQDGLMNILAIFSDQRIDVA